MKFVPVQPNPWLNFLIFILYLTVCEYVFLDTKKLSDLFGEKVLVLKPEEKLPATVRKVLNCDTQNDFYPLDFTKENEKTENAIAVFPKNKVDATRFKIAQQIAGVPIIQR